MSKPIIHPNVSLHETVDISEFVILGKAPRGSAVGELPLEIGEGSVIRSHTVVYAGNKIGRNFQTGHHVMVRESNSIGDNVSLGTGTVVEHHVKIADNVRIHSQAFIPEYTELQEGVWIGPNVVITNARYPNTPSTKDNLEGVVLEAGAIIGANSTILPGVRVGARALIGAGSVVTKDVPPGVVVAGNPAKYIRKASDIESYKW